MDARELEDRRADESHRGEHVPLREANLDVDLAHLLRLSEVGLVVASAEEALEPRDERALETPDLLLIRENSVRFFVLPDPLVELIRDARKVRSREGTEGRDLASVVFGETNVSLQLLEARLH